MGNPSTRLTDGSIEPRSTAQVNFGNSEQMLLKADRDIWLPTSLRTIKIGTNSEAVQEIRKERQKYKPRLFQRAVLVRVSFQSHVPEKTTRKETRETKGEQEKTLDELFSVSYVC